ncbi:hypothetical protein G6F32_015093 [Rhizopus arrhizus]|nr:hypothetical protein G6F32_015093 [Rhizopus arrhizus]
MDRPPSGLAQRDGLGRDDVHQRAALQAGENGRIDFLRDVAVIAQDHAATRPAQRLVRGGRGDVGMRHGRRVDATGDQPREVRHVGHEDRAHVVGDGTEPRKVQRPGIGRAARNDQLGPSGSGTSGPTC